MGKEKKLSKKTKTEKRKTGRPAERPKPTDPGILEKLCEKISSTDDSMKKICEPKDMPALSEVYVEMSRNEKFQKAIARAKELQQEALIDSCHDLAQEATKEDWQVKRLQIWERQWRAAKLAPKKYGEKITHRNDPEDPIPPPSSVTINTVDLSKMNTKDLKALHEIATRNPDSPKQS